jgi:hypothetical protein
MGFAELATFTLPASRSGGRRAGAPRYPHGSRCRPALNRRWHLPDRGCDLELATRSERTWRYPPPCLLHPAAMFARRRDPRSAPLKFAATFLFF